MKSIRWILFLILLATAPFARGQGDQEGTTSALEAVRAAFDNNQSVFEAYNVEDPESLKATRTALGEVFLAGSLDQVHALLKDGTIDQDLSRTLADVRNGMVHEVLQEMAMLHKEVHVTNFSPASNLLNDIDQTFRASERLKEEFDIDQNGSHLKGEFQRIFNERFEIPPERMDVVSHTSEAGIPDWRLSEETHDFVLALRKGSRLLSENPEAYYLEGAFRMQVERRSFAGKDKLYSIYSYAPRADGEVADVGMTITRTDGTIGKLAYKGVAPEIRKSYSAGSTVGNWWFMNAHGGGTRYCAKYGLRSFSEGPGFLVTWDQAKEGEIPQPVEYEKLESYAARQKYCDDVYLKHFRGSDLTRAQLFATLETGRAIRNLGDQYTAEKAYKRRALELAGGDEQVYAASREALLKQADLEFRESMTKLMIRNMEVAVPQRLADWLDPQVDPRVLKIPEQDIKDQTDHYQEEMAKGRKRLRTAALFESMHALRVLEPKIRERVLNASIEALAAHSPRTARKGRYPFERSLRALAKLAGSGDVPRLMQLDSERKRKTRLLAARSNLTIAAVDPEQLRAAGASELEIAVRDIKIEIQAALKKDRLLVEADQPGVVVSTAQDAMARWNQGLLEAEENLKWRAELFLPQNFSYARQQLNRHAWEALGWEARGDWEALKAQHPDVDPISDMTFNKGKLFRNVVNMGNANAVLGIVQAYRKAGTNPGQKEEAVRHALLMEMVGRFPYAGELLQVESILSGKQDPVMGSLLMVGGFLYPGVGQAQLVYSLATGTYEILYDIKRAEWVQREYQGSIPNNDSSPGPGKSTDPAWNDKPGVLHDVYAWTVMRHYELVQEEGFYEGEAKRETQRLLVNRFPKKPVLRHIEANVYDYYRMGLEQSLRRSGRPESEWEAIQLSSAQPPIRSNEPADLVNAADLPPMLRAFFGKIAQDYMQGTGPFATLPAHQAAHAHPLHRELYFHDESPKAQVKATTDLATILTAAYMRSLIAQAQDKETGLKIDPAWDARALTATGAYLRGLPAGGFESLSASRFPDAGPAPALPALLDILQVEESRWDVLFFPHFDELLNRKIDAFKTKDGQPRILDRTAFKLGKHHPILRPMAPENQAVSHPLLLAFFNKVVHDYWERRTEAEGETLPPTPPVGPDGSPIVLDDGFILDPIDLGSVGASETTGAPMDPWPQHRFEPHLRQGYKDMVQPGIVQALVQRYKAGLLADYTRRKSETDRVHLHRHLPAAAALGRMKDTVIGDPERPAQNRTLARDLAAHEFVPNLIPDLLFVQELEAAYRGIPDDVEIGIKGLPERTAGLGSSFRLQALVRASAVHYERPYRTDWEFLDLDAGQRSEEAGVSPSQLTYAHRHEVGHEDDGLEERSVTVLATVTDATGKPMGTASAKFNIGGLDPVIAAEPADPEGGGLDVGDGSLEEDPEVIQRVVYVIRVQGRGWIPHYAGGSYITSGYNDELLYAKREQDPQELIDAYKERLIGELCEKQVPAIPGQHKRPVIWTGGPQIDGIAGPFRTKWEAYEVVELESTWKFSTQDGPSLYKIKGKLKCN